MSERWRYVLYSDTVDDDSTVTMTTVNIPTKTLWDVLWIYVKFTTSNTVANRELQLTVTDTDNDVYCDIRSGVLQAASVVRYYLFAPGGADLVAVRDTDLIQIALPGAFMVGGPATLKIYDNSTADADSDLMEVFIAVNVKRIEDWNVA